MGKARAEVWNDLMAARRALARKLQLEGDLDRHLPDLMDFLIKVPTDYQANAMRYLRESLSRTDLHEDLRRPTIHVLPSLLAYAVIILGWIPKGHTLPGVPNYSAADRARKRKPA